MGGGDGPLKMSSAGLRTADLSTRKVDATRLPRRNGGRVYERAEQIRSSWLYSLECPLLQISQRDFSFRSRIFLEAHRGEGAGLFLALLGMACREHQIYMNYH